MNSANRIDVSFNVGGIKCAAWLYLPLNHTKKSVPALVMAHGLGGVREWRLDNFAQTFREAGYACLVFDYRGFGDSDGVPRQVVDPDMLLQDWREAIAYTRSRSEIDPERIILFGTSFSGGHVTKLGAEDHRLAAIIAQCPFMDGLASAQMTDPIRLLRLTISAIRDLTRKTLGKPPYLIDIGGAPGTNSLVLANEADFAAMIPHEVKSETQIAARIAFEIIKYRPGLSTPKIQCPILFILCEFDKLIPIKSSLKHASHAPLGEIYVVPYGHFDIYSDAPFQDVLTTELDFLVRKVPTDIST